MRHNALPIGVLAVVIGWLIIFRTGASYGIAGRARRVGRGLRERLDGAGELVSELGNRFKIVGRSWHETTYPQARKRIQPDEPMAGYGA